MNCIACGFLSMLYLTGGRIDLGHHDGQAVRAVNDAVALHKAVAKAKEIIDKGA